MRIRQTAFSVLVCVLSGGVGLLTSSGAVVEGAPRTSCNERTGDRKHVRYLKLILKPQNKHKQYTIVCKTAEKPLESWSTFAHSTNKVCFFFPLTQIIVTDRLVKYPHCEWQTHAYTHTRTHTGYSCYGDLGTVWSCDCVQTLTGGSDCSILSLLFHRRQHCQAAVHS